MSLLVSIVNNWKMSPCFPIDHDTNGWSANVKSSCYRLLRFSGSVRLSNLKNFRVGQFTLPTSLPSAHSIVLNGVINIGSPCVPSKIGNAVIERISIVVTALHSFWAWANKCLKDDSVQVCSSCVNGNLHSTLIDVSTPSQSSPFGEFFVGSSSEARKNSSVGSSAVSIRTRDMADFYTVKRRKPWEHHGENVTSHFLLSQCTT